LAGKAAAAEFNEGFDTDEADFVAADHRLGVTDACFEARYAVVEQDNTAKA
jgi:hypothetical protein